MARTQSKGASTADRQLGGRTLVLDNGGFAIKAGFVSVDPKVADCAVIPNCIARSTRDKCTYVGAELESCRDFGELAFRRPVEKGFVVNWEGEKAIWDGSFKTKRGSVESNPQETNLIFTEAPNAPSALQRNADEMVFEEFGFVGYYRCTGLSVSPFAAYAPSPFPSTISQPTGVPLECLMLVDCGYSHTTVTPLLHGQPIHPAVRRLEIGGKTLTNQLKDLISTRSVDVSREDWIVNELKHDVCYIAPSTDQFEIDLEKTWKGGVGDRRRVDSSIVVDYVLPDYENIHAGFARPHDPSRAAQQRRLGVGGGSKEDILVVGNERFTVPELLFNPSDIGLQQAGIPALILQSLEALPETLPETLHQAMLANVVVVGGTSKIPAFMQRLEDELTALARGDYQIRIARAEDPIKNAWLGGARMAANDDVFKEKVVSRNEYLENGVGWVGRKFAGKLGR